MLHRRLRLGVSQVKIPFQNVPIHVTDPLAQNPLRRTVVRGEADETVPECVQVAVQPHSLRDSFQVR